MTKALRTQPREWAAYVPDTLTWLPSKSTNRASIPPKSCFVGGMLKTTPFADISSKNFCRSGTPTPSSTVPAGFFSDAGCSARVVSPVANSLQCGRCELQRQAQRVAMEGDGAIHIRRRT